MSKDKRRVIAVDLDGVLCENQEWDVPSEPEPYLGVIALVNHWYDSGDIIVIHTSRLREDEFKTREWLAVNHVKYHVLVMEKLKADIYLDDKAVNIKDINII